MTDTRIRKLVIVGGGAARAELEAIAGPTVEFRGVVDDAELVKLYGRSRAIVVASEEDFGLTPLEANASGRPVVAYRAGGALETVIDGMTGILYAPSDPLALADAVERCVGTRFDHAILRAHAERFSEAAFAHNMVQFVERAVRSCMTCARSRRNDTGNVRQLRGSRTQMPDAPDAAVESP